MLNHTPQALLFAGGVITVYLSHFARKRLSGWGINARSPLPAAGSHPSRWCVTHIAASTAISAVAL